MQHVPCVLSLVVAMSFLLSLSLSMYASVNASQPLFDMRPLERLYSACGNMSKETSLMFFTSFSHIVPEWYFLCQYAMLNAVPNKNAGFIILFTSIFILFYFMRSLSFSFYFITFTSSRFYPCFWFLNLFFVYLDRWSIFCRQLSILSSYLDM